MLLDVSYSEHIQLGDLPPPTSGSRLSVMYHCAPMEARDRVIYAPYVLHADSRPVTDM